MPPPENQEYPPKQVTDEPISISILTPTIEGFTTELTKKKATLTLGSRYISTSTKDLQTQYCRDFPFVRPLKGKNDFSCEVKDDFIRNPSYKCKPCACDPNECKHTAALYG
jgi:hypothetical protein